MIVYSNSEIPNVILSFGMACNWILYEMNWTQKVNLKRYKYGGIADNWFARSLWMKINNKQRTDFRGSTLSLPFLIPVILYFDFRV